MVNLSAEDDDSKPKSYYASKVINYHQPVFTPGHGDYQNILPLRIVPPPPAIKTRMIAKPSPLYTEYQIPIKKTINIIKYPQQVLNPTNKYRFPATYNPFLGRNSPVNVDHPMNKLYGLYDFQANPPLGIPFKKSGKRPDMNDFMVDQDNQKIPKTENNRILNPEIIDSQHSNKKETGFPILPFAFDNFGRNSYEGILTDPFSDQTGPMGNLSPYMQNPNRILLQKELNKFIV